MKKLILASNNSKKIKEIKEILKDIPLSIKSLKEEGIDIDVVEDGKTFEENSMKKAKEIKEYLLSKGQKDFIVMADDSGLSVDSLNGAPGIYSARYSGEHGNDLENNKKLLRELKDSKNRDAKFVCVISLINDKDKEIVVRGEVEGKITEKLSVEGGFGYDPLFFFEGFNKTFGEATSEEKNSVSHRGVALKKLRDKINEVL
ncbi:RdgB/HAM1 family non-canonical purine NTP pyrophosphatase [Clostridium chrysemydis]|uniref:RdgB/HAM1 family non-canonical purine NTP pyrophosphatase n=1 Tax=Clostridium chrysemydis TaxID=2665504 RepID=UPI001883A7FF|nr:RdgB/HAM1 family non-canonical purine NTP pyrophosphatase [Clostridium chrysemydis]